MEINYPEVGGIKPSSQTLFPQYVKYLFNFVIWGIGSIALLSLVIGGIRYITSAGEPGKLKSAINQITSAFWGILILLSSYLILVNINPEIISFNLIAPEPTPTTPLELPPPTQKVPELLEKVEELANNVKTVVSRTDQLAQKIASQTQNCDCGQTESLCSCVGEGSPGEPCQPLKCYNSNSKQPCPDGPEIKKTQQIVIAFKDELLYYKNRALTEEKDLKDEIAKVLEKEIAFFQKQAGQATDSGVKQALNSTIKILTEEKKLKQDLANLLKKLSDLISGAEKPISDISELPDQCETKVSQICKPSCKQGAEYGCHDARLGCQPDKCSGGNPCPISEIQNRKGQINSSSQTISQLADQIIKQVKKIIDFKAVYTR